MSTFTRSHIKNYKSSFKQLNNKHFIFQNKNILQYFTEYNTFFTKIRLCCGDSDTLLWRTHHRSVFVSIHDTFISKNMCNIGCCVGIWIMSLVAKGQAPIDPSVCLLPLQLLDERQGIHSLQLLQAISGFSLASCSLVQREVLLFLLIYAIWSPTGCAFNTAGDLT